MTYDEAVVQNDSFNRPVHEHDCEKCHYLGTIQHRGDYQYQDLYFCGKGLGDTPIYSTIIARYGRDGQYTSGMCFGQRDAVLSRFSFNRGKEISAIGQAYLLAVHYGYITDKTISGAEVRELEGILQEMELSFTVTEPLDVLRIGRNLQLWHPQYVRAAELTKKLHRNLAGFPAHVGKE